ncbi:EAL domain-containing protein [Vibrio owensii]|uniref:EAL domain-containing protein n=1 Tax=Vibrio owensii TaxID=696485 RepID=UPI0040689D55
MNINEKCEKEIHLSVHFIIFLYLLLVISFSFFIISIELNDAGKRFTTKIENVIHMVEKESILATRQIYNCGAISENLLYSNDIRELLVVDNNRVICSSKRGKIDETLSLNGSFHPSHYHLLLFDVGGNIEERTLALISPEVGEKGMFILSIIDIGYLKGGFFDLNETEFDKIIVKVLDETYPANSNFSSNYLHVTSESEKYNFKILIEAKNKFIISSVIHSAAFCVPLVIVVLFLLNWLIVQYKPRGNLISDFLEGLKRAEFFLEYQPIVDSSNRGVKGYEALVRWKHPTLGLMRPDSFIPIAESKGLLNELTDYVLKWSFRELAFYKGISKLSLNINIPPTYLMNKKSLTKLMHYKNQFLKINVELVVEITERQLINEDAVKAINFLREKGIKIAIDDFGTGYTSLSVIQEISFDYLKIDKCFVDTIGLKTVNATVLDTIIELGKRMDVKTVAEGVETLEQFSYLQKAGVEKMQGYYFSKPRPLNEFFNND